MPTEGQERESRFQFIGWLFFLVCSFLFIAHNVIAGSLIGLAGSIVFLLGCVVFLIPFMWKKG